MHFTEGKRIFFYKTIESDILNKILLDINWKYNFILFGKSRAVRAVYTNEFESDRLISSSDFDIEFILLVWSVVQRRHHAAEHRNAHTQK